MYHVVARSFWIIQSFMCSLRWALSQQEGSAQLMSLCCGSLWSKRSWATTGSALTCSAWEPAACWLTSRGRWGLNTHYFITTLLFCMWVCFFLFLNLFWFLQIYHHITGQYAAYHELPMAWSCGHSVLLTNQYLRPPHKTHTGRNLTHYSINLT